MTPTQAIIAAAQATQDVTDAAGRTLTVRRLTSLDRLRLFKAVGPALAYNERYLGLAGLAFAVVAIDGIPVPQPATEAQVEAAIDRLGDVAIHAIGAALNPDAPSPGEPADATAGN